MELQSSYARLRLVAVAGVDRETVYDETAKREVVLMGSNSVLDRCLLSNAGSRCGKERAKCGRSIPKIEMSFFRKISCERSTS